MASMRQLCLRWWILMVRDKWIIWTQHGLKGLVRHQYDRSLVVSSMKNQDALSSIELCITNRKSAQSLKHELMNDTIECTHWKCSAGNWVVGPPLWKGAMQLISKILPKRWAWVRLWISIDTYNNGAVQHPYIGFELPQVHLYIVDVKRHFTDSMMYHME